MEQKEKQAKKQDIPLFKYLSNIISLKTEKGYINVYRGQSQSYGIIQPGVFRQKAREKSICFNAIRNFPNEFNDAKSRLEQLIIMQHHFIPTRLLDFSTNPLIALYIACTHDFKTDGIIYIWKVKKSFIEFEESSKVRAIACLSFFDNDEQKSILEFCKENANQKICDYDDGKNSEIYNFILKLKEENIPLNFKLKNLLNYYLLMTNKKFSRASVQNSCFMVFNKKDYTDNDIKKLKKTEIKIESRDKIKILKELKILGIDESYVYQDIDTYGKTKYQNKSIKKPVNGGIGK